MSFGCFYLCFSSQDGRASLPDRLLFGIVSKTVLTVFLLLSGLRGLLGIFALVAEPFLGSTVHCATLCLFVIFELGTPDLLL